MLPYEIIAKRHSHFLHFLVEKRLRKHGAKKYNYELDKSPTPYAAKVSKDTPFQRMIQWALPWMGLSQKTNMLPNFLQPLVLIIYILPLSVSLTTYFFRSQLKSNIWDSWNIRRVHFPYHKMMGSRFGMHVRPVLTTANQDSFEDKKEGKPNVMALNPIFFR